MNNLIVLMIATVDVHNCQFEEVEKMASDTTKSLEAELTTAKNKLIQSEGLLFTLVQFCAGPINLESFYKELLCGSVGVGTSFYPILIDWHNSPVGTCGYQHLFYFNIIMSLCSSPSASVDLICLVASV